MRFTVSGSVILKGDTDNGVGVNKGGFYGKDNTYK